MNRSVEIIVFKWDKRIDSKMWRLFRKVCLGNCVFCSVYSGLICAIEVFEVATDSLFHFSSVHWSKRDLPERNAAGCPTYVMVCNTKPFILCFGSIHAGQSCNAIEAYQTSKSIELNCMHKVRFSQHIPYSLYEWKLELSYKNSKSGQSTPILLKQSLSK